MDRAKDWWLLPLDLESIQGICKFTKHRFEDTIVWERCYFWRSEINIDYRLIQCIRGFCSSPLPILKLSLQVPWIDSSIVHVGMTTDQKYVNKFYSQSHFVYIMLIIMWPLVKAFLKSGDEVTFWDVCIALTQQYE